MMKQLAILVLFTISAFAQTLNSETFCTLDREVAGLMDAWIILTEGNRSTSAGLFVAGTAILRAEAAFTVAVLADDESLPDEVKKSWTAYLKSSADCINDFRMVVGSSDSLENENDEVLLTSFARWETRGGEFLESVQSTR